MPTAALTSDRPISDYGVLSDCHSAALVSGDGSIDWLCVPRFDSPSIFGRLLDPNAGHWSIHPVGDFESVRRYLPGSLVLETRFVMRGGSVTVTDALVFEADEQGHELVLDSPQFLVRVVEAIGVDAAVEAEFAPRMDYGLAVPQLAVSGDVVTARGEGTLLVLSGLPAGVDLRGGTARWRLSVGKGERVAFGLQVATASASSLQPPSQRAIEGRLKDTLEAWRSWSRRHETYDGPWRDLVHQSGRVLHGLTFAPTGAMVAAPTTSLPEGVGGSRNWDHRFCWLRHAGMTMAALCVTACPHEALQFVRWMTDAVGGGGGSGNDGEQIVYGVGGEHDLSERVLGHLHGWRDSGPVRVGNGEWKERQVGAQGELVDAYHRLFSETGEIGDIEGPGAAAAGLLARLADGAAGGWREPGGGMWNVRNPHRHSLHSRLMCWLALDRAVRLANQLRTAPERLAMWKASRAEIGAAILERSWSEAAGAYTQSFGSGVLDTSSLLLAVTGFLPATDVRMRATIERVAAELSAPCGLLFRYHDRDAPSPPFVPETFWLVECLALAGELDRASELFEGVVAYANDLGLLAEAADPQSGMLFGNFPHASSHVGLVNAALAVARAEERARSAPVLNEVPRDPWPVTP